MPDPCGTLIAAVPPGTQRVLVRGADAAALAGRARVSLPGAAVFTVPTEPAVDCVLAAGDLGPDECTSLRALLAPGGCLLWLLPNPLHHAALAALLRGDAPAESPRPCVWALRRLLDAGFSPGLDAWVSDPAPDEFLRALAPLAGHLGLHPKRLRAYLNASHYLLRAEPLAEPPAGPAPPLTIAACMSDRAVLRANLLESPDLAPGSVHQFLPLRDCRCAADGLLAALTLAEHDPVVLAHQDVYLPAGWAARFAARWREAAAGRSPIGVAGVYGAFRDGAGMRRAGHVVDREWRRCEGGPLPADVEALDELLLAVPRGSPLRADRDLGFHLYGADLCLRARAAGLRAVALDAPCLHHSRTVELPAAFADSARVLARRWRDRLPVATPCALIDHSWLGPEAPATSLLSATPP